MKNASKNRLRYFVGKGIRVGAKSINALLHYNWSMLTPRESYYKQLEDMFKYRSKIPRIDVVCETFSSCLSRVAQSDFLGILPQKLGCDPLLTHHLAMLPIEETLPKAAYDLIQRRDSRQTPLTLSLITQFRRHAHGILSRGEQ